MTFKSLKEENFQNIEKVSDFFKLKTGINFEKQTDILRNKCKSFCLKNGIFSIEELPLKILISLIVNLKRLESLILSSQEICLYILIKQQKKRQKNIR
jgi:hypothetical protein